MGPGRLNGACSVGGHHVSEIGMSTSLKWGLTICTYNREQVLRRAVRLALTQTRPPSEVVIIDTTPNWEACKKRFEEELGPLLGDTPWSYETSPRNTLPFKRNLAIDSASSDVVFMIDDDSLMYPDCAEEVMKVYEADEAGKVVGVTMTGVDYPPDEPAPPADAKPHYRRAPPLLRPIEYALSEQKLRFLPYDGEYHEPKLPKAVADLGAIPCSLIGGFRMTFRRDVIAKVRFPEYLEGYAVGEDFDASYRASRFGALALAPRAKVHHLEEPGGRPGRSLKAGFTCLNVIAMNALHADRAGLRSRCRNFVLQRLGIALATDVGRLRLALPDTRGLLFAWRHMGDILSRQGPDLESWYLEFQRQHRSG